MTNWKALQALYGELSSKELAKHAFVATHEALLKRYPKEAKLLDAACGSGVWATALALSGGAGDRRQRKDDLPDKGALFATLHIPQDVEKSLGSASRRPWAGI